MAVEITHVRYGSTPKTEEVIVRYKWRNVTSGKVGDNDKPSMVDYIENKHGIVYVGSGSSRVDVGVVHPTHGQPYLRTHADGKWTNNLTSLNEF